MKLLVTGGAGFLGVHVVERLVRDPVVEQVVVLDHCSYTAVPQALPESSKVHFVRGEVNDQELITSLVRGSDAVIHLAAETFVDNSIADDDPFVDTNIGGTLAVLRALREVGERRRLVHASTDEVWGEATSGVFTEESAYRPRNPYAATKAAADHLVRAYGITHGLDVTICHFTNLFGPWQYPEKLIPFTVARLLRGGTARVYGTGHQSRTWLHVADAADAVLKILHQGGSQESYVIGGVAEHATLEIVTCIVSLLHIDDDVIEFTTDRPGHDARYAVDDSKVRLDLGWQPTIGFAQGLADTVSWLVAHDGWWQ